MRAAFALRIISGKIIFNRAMPERLRTLRHCIFTGGVVKENSICSAASCESAALRACVLALSVFASQIHLSQRERQEHCRKLPLYT